MSTVYRVWLGLDDGTSSGCDPEPYPTRQEAEAVVVRLLAAGDHLHLIFPDVPTVVEGCVEEVCAPCFAGGEAACPHAGQDSTSAFVKRYHSAGYIAVTVRDIPARDAGEETGR